MVSPATLFKNASNIHDDIINEIYFSDDMIQIEIESPSGSSNVVTVDENGNWNCTCENYYFSKVFKYLHVYMSGKINCLKSKV